MYIVTYVQLSLKFVSEIDTYFLTPHYHNLSSELLPMHQSPPLSHLLCFYILSHILSIFSPKEFVFFY